MTNCFSRPLYTDASSTSSIRDRLKWKLETRAGKTQFKNVRRSAYLDALNEASAALDQYKKVARCLLMPAPDEKLVDNLQTISLREQWERSKGHDGVDHNHAEYMKTLKLLWPSWKPPSAQEAPSDEGSSPADRLYGDTLQSVLMFLEPTELAACMMVSRSWMATAKRPKVWTGKVLQIADLVAPGMSMLYTVQWASLALRHVEGVVVVSSRPNDHTYNMYGNICHLNTHCYSQLKAALSRKALPNIRRICILQYAAVGLAQSLAGNPHVEEVFVGDSAVRSSFSDRASLLQTVPNLRVARIATFADLNMWNSQTIRNEFYRNIDANRSLRHLIFPLQINVDEQRLVKPYELVSKHPSLKTLELQIYGTGSAASTVAIILKHCRSICGNLELLHIKQLGRPGFTPLIDELRLEDHLAAIKGALLQTVLLEKSKMRVQIELVAGSLTIKRYRKMLRELPSGAAELAKERVWVRASKPNSAKGDPLFSLI
jgi:hypothetical protein